MEDLSRVDNFSALRWEDVGSDGNTSFDFRGPRGLGFEFPPGGSTGAGAAGEESISAAF